MSVDTAGAGAPTTTDRGRAGWHLVASKELADHLRSARFGIVAGLLSLSAVVAVVAAAARIREVAPQASDDPSLFLRLFTVPIEGTPFAFFNLIALLGPLLGIAFGFDAINAERSQRTLPMLLSQPIHRDDVVNGKAVAGVTAIALVLAVLTAIVAGVGIVGLGIIPSLEDVIRLVSWLVISIAYIALWLGIAMFLSVQFDRAATSALTSLAAWLVLALFAGLIVGIAADLVAPVADAASASQVLTHARVERWLSRLSPGFVYEEATSALLRPELRTLGVLLPEQTFRAIPGQLPATQSLLLVWPQIVGLVATTMAVFAGSYVTFLRQEVRA